MVARPEVEREQKSVDQRGNYRYMTREYFLLTNAGGSTARAVTVSWLKDQECPMIHDADGPIEYLARDVPVRLPVFGSLGESNVGPLLLSWQDETGRPYEERQTIRF